jgi:cyclopropane-fatty-acyl-phospholipid synthase
LQEWQARARANRQTVENVAPGLFEPLMAYLDTANTAWGYTTKHYALTASRVRLGKMDDIR